VCSRAIIIGNGRIVADGTPEALRSRSVLHGAVTLELTGEGIKDALADLQKIEGVARVEELKNDDLPAKAAVAKGEEAAGSAKNGKSSLRVRLFPKKGVAIAHEAAKFVHERKWEVDAFTLEKGDLNEVFYNLTRGGEKA